MSPSSVRITSLICLCRVSGEGGRIPKASLSWTLGALQMKSRSVADGFLFPLESLVEDDRDGFSGVDMAKIFARDLWVTSLPSPPLRPSRYPESLVIRKSQSPYFDFADGCMGPNAEPRVV